MIRYCSRFHFATNKRSFYDVIFIGPLATLVSRHFQSESHGNFSSLVINSRTTHLEPCLIPLKAKPLPISDIICRKMENCDQHISKVLPDISKIQYPDGTEIGYRQLVFTQSTLSKNSDDEPVLDKIEGLREALSNPHSMVFSNRDSSRLNELYHIQTGNIVFSVPKGRHTGYDNYLFLHLISAIRARNNKNPQKRVHCDMTIINEGDTFFPYHESLEKYLRQLLKENDIEVLDNTSLKAIESGKREVTLSNGKTLNYSGLYHYMELKQPKELEGIHSSDINKHTLRNNKYNNIFIFGNSEPPTTHSFYALNHQLRTVKQNLINSLVKAPRQAIYDGKTGIPFWRAYNQCIYFLHDYESKSKYDGLGKNKLLSRIFAFDRKYSTQLEVETYYRFIHYGHPSYYRHPKIVQVYKTGEKSAEAENLLPPRKKTQ